MRTVCPCLALALVVYFSLPAHAQTIGTPNSATVSQPWVGGYLGAKDTKRKTVIVFVHGVLGDYQSTWTNKNGVYWPQLVAKDPGFQDANVYVHRFDSPKLETAQDVEELATRLGDFLDKDGVIRDHNRIVFVCHSMGGLITRAFLVQRRLPPKKVPLIYFFGTPTAGANAASLAYLVSKNEQFRNMMPFVPGSYVEALAKKWLATSEDRATGYPKKIWSYCAYEKKEYLGRIIVDELSATHLCNAQPRSILSDHLDMVKPDSLNSEPHVYLTKAYQIAAGPAGEQMLAALNSPSQMSGTVSLTSFSTGIPSKLRYRTAYIDAGALRVDCNETRRGERTVFFRFPKRENLLGAFAAVDSSQGLTHSTVSVSSWGDNKIAFIYDLKGTTTQTSDCSNVGIANVRIKYLTVEND